MFCAMGSSAAIFCYCWANADHYCIIGKQKKAFILFLYILVMFYLQILIHIVCFFLARVGGINKTIIIVIGLTHSKTILETPAEIESVFWTCVVPTVMPICFNILPNFLSIGP